MDNKNNISAVQPCVPCNKPQNSALTFGIGVLVGAVIAAVVFMIGAHSVEPNGQMGGPQMQQMQGQAQDQMQGMQRPGQFDRQGDDSNQPQQDSDNS